ncbi:MAG: DNA starvation/stationary phase protection protein [Phycisphaerales bacterium]
MGDQKVIEHLNGLLADAVVSYFKLHHYHWLVSGARFAELHEQFEELYESAHTDLDELAERVLIIGGKPVGTLKDAVALSAIKEETTARDADTMLHLVIEDLGTRVQRLRAAAAVADEKDDRGTTGMLDELIGRLEKTIWLLRSSVGSAS